MSVFSTSLNTALGAINSQTFTFQGRLLSDSGSGGLSDSIELTLSILDPSGDCTLYEEKQSIGYLAQTDGLFSVQVGSSIPNVKRSLQDPGNLMSKVFSNSGVIAAVSASVNVCTSYSPQSGDQRLLRVVVNNLDTGQITQLSPDFAVSSVPQATTSETLQGLVPSQLIQTSTNVTQARLEKLTNGTNDSQSDASALHHHDSHNDSRFVQLNQSSVTLGSLTTGTGTISGGTGSFTSINSGNITLGSDALLKLGSHNSSPSLTPSDAGKIWFESGLIKFYDGASTQTLAQTSGSNVVSSISSGTGITVSNGGSTSPQVALNVSTTSPLKYQSGTFSIEGVTGFGPGNQLLGTPAGPTVTNLEYKSLVGTANQVTVTPSSGFFTFSTPQDIHSTANPTFAGLTVSGAASAAAFAATSSNASSSPVTIKGTTGQSAGLTQWLDSSSTVVASVGSDGKIIATSGLSIPSGGTGQVLGWNTGDNAVWTTLPTASGSQTGFLSSTDFITFGSKQSALGYIPVNKAGDTMTAGASTTVPLVIKGAASQSANLTEWRDPTGSSILGSIDNTGKITASGGLNLPNSGGGSSGEVLGWSTGNNAIWTTLPIASGSQAGFLSSADFNTFSSKQSALGYTPVNKAGDTITAGASTTVPLVVKGAVGQSVNLTEWKNSAGSTLGSIDNTGKITASGGLNLPNSGGGSSGEVLGWSTGHNAVWTTLPTASGSQAGFLSSADFNTFSSKQSALGYTPVNKAGDTITAGASTTVPLVVKGASSQSANLTEWKNSAGSTLSSINSNGKIIATDGQLSNFGVGIAATGSNFQVNGTSILNGTFKLDYNNSTKFQLYTDGQVYIDTILNARGGMRLSSESIPVTYGHRATNTVNGVSFCYTCGGSNYSLYSTGKIIAPQIDIYSDRRLKHSIKSISKNKGLQFIRQVNPVTYYLKSEPDGRLQYGFIAQEMIKAGFGEFVGIVSAEGINETVTPDGFVSPKNTLFNISYARITSIITQALKDLYDLINTNTQELKILREQNQAIKNELMELRHSHDRLKQDLCKINSQSANCGH